MKGDNKYDSVRNSCDRAVGTGADARNSLRTYWKRRTRSAARRSRLRGNYRIDCQNH